MIRLEDDALIEQHIVEHIFKERGGLIPEYIEKKVDEEGNIIGWVPHFSPGDLNFTVTEKGRKKGYEY